MYSQYSGLHQYQLAGTHSGAPSLMIPAHSQQPGELHQYRHQQPGSPGTSLVGRPILFTEGQFKGKTIRAELRELQAAAFGRKYAKVDRRPLDPPPVAWLRLFEVHNAGTESQHETEIDYDSIHILGLMCTVNLLPVPAPDGHPSPGPSAYAPSPYSPPPQSPYGSMSPGAHSHYSAPSSPGAPEPVGAHNATTALAGNTFVQVDSIPWNGQTSLLFTFADLAVKSEGYFILQYRFFDLYSRPAGAHQTIQADCTGACFRIYSSKEVPHLGKSTELTKHLARYGVRVNVRETERKRKKRERLPSASPPYTTQHLSGASNASADEDD
ncbi:velvet factor-domain-containing protein [Mycena rosella]|uniref:Velvet factor-domain-containing protein n=1 Tax=Mycena rosella TaxID=1033263 RepID=A0AAD7GMQ4_MYCRO|nr:velvet factor-domain-containing protein [Mycena rosella]